MHMLNILLDYMGLTQVELAKKAGISAADLNEMINKKPYGMITKYQRLAGYLHVTVDSIVNNDILRISESFFDNHHSATYLEPVQNKRVIIGRQAEEAAFHIERQRVHTFSPTLAKLVLPYYKMRTSSPGYDILSFSPGGHPVFIEVKNSVKCNITEFSLTSHEYQVARKAAEDGVPYLVYVFSGWGTSNQTFEIKQFADLDSANRITPVNYRCNLREIRTTVNGITYHRMMHNLSQIELASTLDIPTANLCKYEIGGTTCPVTVYQQLAAFFHVSIDDLLMNYPNPSIAE